MPQPINATPIPDAEDLAGEDQTSVAGVVNLESAEDLLDPPGTQDGDYEGFGVQP